MKKIFLLTLVTTVTLFAQIKVATTYSYLGEITKKIGKNLVQVDVLADPKLDPHFITPKPSLIAKLRREDLLIINGAQLEIGWLPPLLRSANNPKILPNQKGFLDVSKIINMINKPASVSRSFGDVHPDGNPHFGLDIHNVLDIAELISMKLSQIDPQNTDAYRDNFIKFKEEFTPLIASLDKKMQKCNAKKVVQYHELFNYVLNSYKLISVATIEPLPGISPSSKHVMQLINIIKKQNIKTILQDVYHERKTAKFIASKTDAKLEIIPHDVGSMNKTDTLEDFYKTIADKLCH